MRVYDLLWPLALALAGAGGASGQRTPIHTVVPVECGKYFTWQSLGIFYSHRKIGQPGKITRVACCTPQDAERYADIMHIVPTHVAPSYTVHPKTGDVYSAYNKPLAVLDFLAKNEVEEEYILVIDADMIFVQRFDPISIGVTRGWAVSAFFGYMKGVYNDLALKHIPEVAPRNDTLAGPNGRRGDMCGGFTFMMRDDLKRVAPLWLKYTEDVRFDPDAWKLSGDQYAIHPGDKPWISEMYGYAYGCAKADVWHIAARTAMEYPEYDLAEPPMVMHYGLIFEIPNTGYSFDKHWFYDFDALACPPWKLGETQRSMRGLFNHPPMPSTLKTKGLHLMRDLYAIFTINTLNEAFCEHHYVNCPPSEELDQECKTVHEISRQVDAGLDELDKQGVGACDDGDPRCPLWQVAGECEKNPYYMLAVCRRTCKQCHARDAGRAHLGSFNHAQWEQRFTLVEGGAAAEEQERAVQVQEAAVQAQEGAVQGQEAAVQGQEGAVKEQEGSIEDTIFGGADGSAAAEGDGKGVQQQVEPQPDGAKDTAGADERAGSGGGDAGADIKAVEDGRQQQDAVKEAGGGEELAKAVQAGGGDGSRGGAAQGAQEAGAGGEGVVHAVQEGGGNGGEAAAAGGSGEDGSKLGAGGGAQQQLGGVGGGGAQPVHPVRVAPTHPAVRRPGEIINAAQLVAEQLGGDPGVAAGGTARVVVGDQLGMQAGRGAAMRDDTRRALEQERGGVAGGVAGKASGGKWAPTRLVERLAERCRKDPTLSALQVADCMDAAKQGVEYVRPATGGAGSGGVRKPVTMPHTITHFDDEDGPGARHRSGLLQHAAGGVGFMVWCGLGLLVFMFRPYCFPGRVRRKLGPPAARRLPL